MNGDGYNSLKEEYDALSSHPEITGEKQCSLMRIYLGLLRISEKILVF